MYINADNFTNIYTQKATKTQDVVMTEKLLKKVKKIFKKCLQFGLTCGIILKYAVIIWRETCDDAGGGPTRLGKFLRSMSDFKPGERTRMHLGNLRPLMQRRSDSLSGIDCDPSNAGFILCGDEKHGTV